jgi:hypothetical protein
VRGQSHCKHDKLCFVRLILAIKNAIYGYEFGELIQGASAKLSVCVCITELKTGLLMTGSFPRAHRDSSMSEQEIEAREGLSVINTLIQTF